MVDEYEDGRAAEAPAEEGARAEGAGEESERLRAENAALKEQALRYAAEAENTRRRAERDANDARAFAIQRFARDLLDAADNLARALEHAPRDSEDAGVKTLVMGVEMTEKALQTAFERNGLKRIQPERGEKFDPNRHQAMIEQPAEDLGPGVVVTVMQGGYELLGRLIRPALVAVTPRAPAPKAEGGYGRDGAAAAGASLDETA